MRVAAAGLLLLAALGGASPLFAQSADEKMEEVNAVLDGRAADAPAAGGDLAPPEISVGWLAAKIVIVLALLSAGIYGVFRLAVRARLPLLRESGVVRKIALEPIAPDRYLQIIEIGGKVMVLGVTSASITHVATLEGEAADAVRLAASRSAAGGASARFVDRLKAAWPGGAEGGSAGGAPRSTADRLRAEKKRLQSLEL